MKYINVNDEFFNYDATAVDEVENILKSEMYVYFTKMYQLKVESVRNISNSSDKRVVLSSSVGNIERNLATFTLTKRVWWNRATGKSARKRNKIRDYDWLLNIVGNVEECILPDYCPVFGNLRLNYTGIDFEGGYNLRKCCNLAGYMDRGETWSPATIDRVDNERGYEYGNIRVISHYANTLKRDSNITQLQMVIDYIKSDPITRDRWAYEFNL